MEDIIKTIVVGALTACATVAVLYVLCFIVMWLKEKDFRSKIGSMWRGAHPCWVSVKDELPKKDGRYLFYDEVLGPQVSVYYDGCTLVSSITHWMPLPQPPSCFQFRKKAMNDEERMKKTIEEEENFYENLKWEQRRYEIARHCRYNIKVSND